MPVVFDCIHSYHLNEYYYLYHEFLHTHLDVIRVLGTFTSANVIGETSNATFTVSTSDDTATMNTAFESIDDNARIEADADGILDFSETNPFGEA